MTYGLGGERFGGANGVWGSGPHNPPRRDLPKIGDFRPYRAGGGGGEASEPPGGWRCGECRTYGGWNVCDDHRIREIYEMFVFFS